MQKLQGWVEQGNTQLTITGAAGTIARKVQGSYPGATVTVFRASISVGILAITRTSNVVTVTVPTGSGFITGEMVTIAGVANPTFNGGFVILATTPTTFTYAQTGTNTSSTGGTATPFQSLVSIYADDGITAKANPFVSPADGTWYFYAPDGRYDVRFSGAGIAVPFTLGDLGSDNREHRWVDITQSPYN